MERFQLLLRELQDPKLLYRQSIGVLTSVGFDIKKRVRERSEIITSGSALLEIRGGEIVAITGGAESTAILCSHRTLLPCR